jgi:chromosome segregation ATPase
MSKLSITANVRNIEEEINRLSSREATLNSQFPEISHHYKDIKLQLYDYLNRARTTNDSLRTLSVDLASVTEKLDDYKDSAEAKDSGNNDTSPLVRVKAALHQIKSEIMNFDLKIGVVSNSLMTAKHSAIKASQAKMLNKLRHKNKGSLRKGAAARLEDSVNSMESDE